MTFGSGWLCAQRGKRYNEAVTLVVVQVRSRFLEDAWAAMQYALELIGSTQSQRPTTCIVTRELERPYDESCLGGYVGQRLVPADQSH